jgi:hypothetical protein
MDSNGCYAKVEAEVCIHENGTCPLCSTNTGNRSDAHTVIRHRVEGSENGMRLASIRGHGG